MNRRIRKIVGILVLSLSIAILVWAYRPLDRIINTQPVSPADLQLPTPVSLLVQPEGVS